MTKRMTRRWIAGLAVSLLVSGLVETPSALAGADVVTNRAKITASSFDGVGTVGPPVTEEASDVSAFSEAVNAFDDLNQGRSAEAEATQDTTVDFTDPTPLARSAVDTSGAARASFTDGPPGDGANPAGRGTSEFTITIAITDFDTPFSLVGSIEATADATNANCTTVTVTSPSGTRFDVAAPAGCGSPGQTIDDSGMLAVGTHTFSVVANASAANPNAAGGSAEASFDLILTLGCTITGTDGADVLVGSDTTDDRICGLGGDDQIDGLGGNDFLLGGLGNDTLRGGPGLDRIFGEGDNDVISGGEGLDFLFGGDGNDVINGDEEQDVIEGGLGNDILAGGDGVDIIDGDNGSFGAVFGIVNDCAVATSGPGLNDDEIFGGSEQDFIRGCQGLDKLRGEGGDDEIDGNTGNDVLLGGPGRDKLRGQRGRDTLDGGPRRDVLLGGPGNDLLRARDGVKDTVKGGPGGNDRARVDNRDEVTGVEVFLP